MKKYYGFVILLVLLCCLLGFAQADGKCGANVSWSLDGGILHISGTGAMEDYYFEEDTPWYDDRYSIFGVEIGSGVTSIGMNAFSNCIFLSNASIPEGVISIGANAFFGCSNLWQISLPDTVTSLGYSVFSRSGLRSISVPDSVTALPNAAFYCCTNLETVDLPAGLYLIDSYAFYQCSSLTRVNYGGTQNQWNEIAFGVNNEPLLHAAIQVKEEHNIHHTVSGVCSVCGRYFSAEGMNVLILPDALHSIDEEAFAGIAAEAVIVPENCGSIGPRAFAGCTALQYIFLPEGIEDIAEDALPGGSIQIIYQ